MVVDMSSDWAFKSSHDWVGVRCRWRQRDWVVISNRLNWCEVLSDWGAVDNFWGYAAIRSQWQRRIVQRSIRAEVEDLARQWVSSIIMLPILLQ